jgi:S-phase kinase-associated protein 1
MTTNADFIKLITKPEPDGTIPTLVLAKNAAKLSNLIESMIMDDDADDELTEIPVMEVAFDVMKKIAEFLEKHVNDPLREIPKPIPSNKIQDFVSEWDVKYIDLPQAELFKLISAANYLNITQLLDLGTLKLACMIKDKEPEDIKQMFGIDNITQEEELQVRRSNAWIFEVVDPERRPQPATAAAAAARAPAAGPPNVVIAAGDQLQAARQELDQQEAAMEEEE